MTKIDSEHYKSYCICLGEALRECVIEAQEKRKRSQETDEKEFDAGYLCAFHRIITLMQQQAEVFDIPFDELGINFEENELII